MKTNWVDIFWQHRASGVSVVWSFILAMLSMFSHDTDDANAVITIGHEKLHAAFGLSYAKWLKLPRSLMYSMPDDWQDRMANLLDEFVDAFDVEKIDEYLRDNDNDDDQNAEWLQYRHVDADTINMWRRKC